MKGQVFTVAKLHYVNGVVYAVADRGATDLQTLADLSAETTRSGNVKHPMVRVRTMARMAQGLGLIDLYDKDKVLITELGKQYANARADDKWSLSKEQQKILGGFILANPYRTETIYSIHSLFELCKKGYEDDELALQFAFEIGKDDAWKSEVTFRGFTKFGLDYISELGLLDIDEKDLLIENIAKEQKYQEDVNIVSPIQIREGKLARPKPTKTGGKEKYTTNPRRGKNALIKADYKCELNPAHETFINKTTNKPYMEGHHLIPMSEQGNFEYDIDVPENILCLCPTCHRKLHHGTDEVKKEILTEEFGKRKNALQDRGIDISINQLLKMYTIG